MDKFELLKQYFGHDSFRDGQENIIDNISSGRDALCIDVYKRQQLHLSA